MKNLFVRIGAIVLALLMVATVAGCGGSSDGPNKKLPSQGDTVINDNVDPKEFNGTEITYATWRNPEQYEDGPVYFSTYTFPYCLDALQPIDAAKLNLEESIWDKSLIDLATVNGKTYLVDTVGNIWKDEDMVFYNKNLFSTVFFC